LLQHTRTWLDITSLSSALSYTQSLAGVYALTGCDYTPYFYRKGKVKGIELMEKQERMVKAFASLGNEELNEDTIKVLEEFVCRLYSSKFDNVNDAILQFFNKKNASLTLSNLELYRRQTNSSSTLIVSSFNSSFPNEANAFTILSCFSISSIPFTLPLR
jgi:hypothetical protein